MFKTKDILRFWRWKNWNISWCFVFSNPGFLYFISKMHLSSWSGFNVRKSRVEIFQLIFNSLFSLSAPPVNTLRPGNRCHGGLESVLIFYLWCPFPQKHVSEQILKEFYLYTHQQIVALLAQCTFQSSCWICNMCLLKFKDWKACWKLFCRTVHSTE